MPLADDYSVTSVSQRSNRQEDKSANFEQLSTISKSSINLTVQAGLDKTPQSILKKPSNNVVKKEQSLGEASQLVVDDSFRGTIEAPTFGEKINLENKASATLTTFKQDSTPLRKNVQRNASMPDLTHLTAKTIEEPDVPQNSVASKE